MRYQSFLPKNHHFLLKSVKKHAFCCDFDEFNQIGVEFALSYSNKPKFINMKNLQVQLAIMVSLFAMTTFAQDDYRDKVVFGLKAGMNYSNVWDEKNQDFQADGKAGFAGGAFVTIPLGTILALQPEVLVSQKGFQGSGRFLTENYSYSTTTTFLDVPLLLAFRPSPHITFLAGPQYSFLLSQRNTFSSEFYSSEELQEYENDNIRKNLLGIHVGADVNIDHFVISPRAGWDFQANHGDGTSSTPRYKNQWLQLTLGYRF